MKISTIINELSKKYSYHFFAYFSMLTVLEFILYFSLPLLMFEPSGVEVLVFLLAIFCPTIFLFLLLMKFIIFRKIQRYEIVNTDFEIKNNFLKNNIFYRIFLLLLSVFTIIVVYGQLLFTIKCFRIDDLSYYLFFYTIFIFLLILYWLISKTKKNIKTDIVIYFIYLAISMLLVVFIVLASVLLN